MRILGIDPGTGIVGFGVIETNGFKHSLIEAGVIRTPAHQALDLRLITIYDSILQIIKSSKPDYSAIEKLFFAQNVTTAISVSHARGVIMLALAQSNIPISEYTPLQIKQAITGYGKAEKKQIQEMVRAMLNLKEVPKPDDCADALAAAITHSTKSNILNN
jgi:crossover junction endodeoxyribonuclease RuvC